MSLTGLSTRPAYGLIALDFDGALLDSRRRIRAGNAAAIGACQAAGVRVTLATGKLLAATRRMSYDLGITAPQITANGAVIITADPEAVLHVDSLPGRRLPSRHGRARRVRLAHGRVHSICHPHAPAQLPPRYTGRHT